MFFRKILRKIKLKIYDQKNIFLKTSETYSFITSLFVIASITINFGFNDSIFSTTNNILILTSSVFYALVYIIKLILHINIISFLKKNALYNMVISFIFLHILINLFNYNIFNYSAYKNLIFLLINLYFFFNTLSYILKNSSSISNKNVSPTKLLVLSFIVLISLGTLLLMMPAVSQEGVSISLSDALFTSISATCVTGLTVLDTATIFSEKGHMIIMGLIQLGGINIIAFATFFAFFSRASGGIKQQQIISENFNSKSLLSGKNLLKKVLIFSFLIEFLGAFFIFISYNQEVDGGIFDAIFHSISAFNNAGFTISNHFQQSINLKIILSILIFLGAIGFPTLSDLSKNLSLYKKLKWRKLHLTTRISLVTSLLLIIFGLLTFLMIENTNNEIGNSRIEKIINGIFHSTSARTAGFSSLDFESLSFATLIIFVFLMFIGASPGSTGGGIKTNTFTLLFYSSLATIRGKKHIEIGSRKISSSLLHKSYVIFLLSLLIIFFGWILLLITEKNLNPIHLLFEQVSAFSTVGLSVGETTNNLSLFGKIIIMITMFIGRIGTLLMAFSLMQKKRNTNYQYPEAHLMVG